MARIIDSEILIAMVEARPVLWDKTLAVYKDRNLSRNAWNEVCIELHSEFEDLGDKEKNAFGKEVIHRWTNIRDSFSKSFKKIKESKSSGSAAKKQRLYVYNNELQFLKKLYADRETSNSLSEDGCCFEVEEVVVAKPLDTGTDDIMSENFKKPTATRKHRKVDEIELKILKALEPKEPEKPDPNMSFFQSLIPHLENFNAEEILQFQMGVLQVVSSLNERKKGTAHPPQYFQQTNSYSPSHLVHPAFSKPSPFHNPSQQSLIPAPTKQMSQQYHQYNRHPPFKQFSRSPAVPFQTQPFTNETPSKSSRLKHHSSVSSKILFSENDDSFHLGEETECRKPVGQLDENLFRSEADSRVSSPESTNSVDFTIT